MTVADHGSWPASMLDTAFSFHPDSAAGDREIQQDRQESEPIPP